MGYFLCSLVLVITYLLTLLCRTDPFQRELPFRREYKIAYLNSRTRFYDAIARVTFTKRASSHTLSEVLSHVFYLMKAEASIKFDSPFLAGCPGDFNLYHFKTLDFSNVDFKPHVFPYFDEIAGQFPCETLILPKNITEIRLIDCSNLERLVLPGKHLLQYTPYAYYPPGTNFEVKGGNHGYFNILVPHELVDEYRNCPSWQNICLVNELGEIIRPNFAAY